MRTSNPILSAPGRVAGAVGVLAALAAFAMTTGTAQAEIPAVAPAAPEALAAPAAPAGPGAPGAGQADARVKAAPIVHLNPTSHNFGSLAVGSTSPTQTFTVTNTGNAPYAITHVTIGGTNAGDFVMSADMCTGTSVPGPAGSCTVKVAFKPTTGGPRTGTLTVTDQVGPEHVRVATLQGTGSVTTTHSPSPSPSPSTTPSPSASPSSSVTPSAPVTTPPTKPELPVTGGGPLVPALVGTAGLLLITGFALRRLTRARRTS
ncbi:choice-of-anchor D domain-containing protein [Longispora sp. K20-0274]|uniref:choice-of-anchor D domain-containing protein n=1 Tax=Longispora sp. K20-0274 TaxID=3088255 RepID=UPI00399BD86A